MDFILRRLISYEVNPTIIEKRRRRSRASCREDVDVAIGSLRLATQPLGDEASGTGSPAASTQEGVDLAGVNGLVVSQTGLLQPNFDIDGFEHFQMDDRHIADQDEWTFSLIGKWIGVRG